MALASALGCQRQDRNPAPSSQPPASLSPSPPAATAAPKQLYLDEVVPAASTTPARPAKPLKNLLIIGDSLSDEAVGGGGFVRLLRERCTGASIDNRAKGGFMVNQMRKRLEKEILPAGQSYSHAIVFGGVNDLYSDQTANRTLARIEGDLGTIYRLLKAQNVDVIAITVTPWGGFKKWFSAERGKNTLSLNGWIVQQAEQGAVTSALDAYPLLSCGDPERLCPALAAPYKDGLHFGKLGHEKLGEALLAQLPCQR